MVKPKSRVSAILLKVRIELGVKRYPVAVNQLKLPQKFSMQHLLSLSERTFTVIVYEAWPA